MCSPSRGFRLVALFCAFNLCLPWEAVAVEPLRSEVPQASICYDLQSNCTDASTSRDVQLDSESNLTGQVVTSNGKGVSQLEVGLVRGATLVGLATTDDTGRFQLSGVKGGTYQLAAGGKTQLLRVWSDQTAPPSASETTVLILGTEVVRGQQPCGCGSVGCADCVGPAPNNKYAPRGYNNRPIVRWMRANPGLVLAGIAAAIAIPIAIVASDDDDAS